MEDNIFKTRFFSQPGESKIEKDLSKKSLTHEEAIDEIHKKTNELLELLNEDENNRLLKMINSGEK